MSELGFGQGVDFNTPNTWSDGTGPDGSMVSLITLMLVRVTYVSDNRGRLVKIMLKLRRSVLWYLSLRPMQFCDSMPLNFNESPKSLACLRQFSDVNDDWLSGPIVYGNTV